MKTLRIILPLAILASLIASCTQQQTEPQTIHILYTTDVHGAIFPYDFVNDKSVNHSLAQVDSYVTSVRDTAENTILLDCGDFLQGTPATYYFNYVSTSTNITSQIFNYMNYDAVCVGNHDIETGHAVYDKVRSEMQMPLLAANAVNTSTGEPYFEPYIIIERGSKKIAIIGLITPHIPHWLSENIWSGMQFEDMIETAEKLIVTIREKENPDAVIGLFHSGYDFTYGGMTADTYLNENASLLVAQRVSGFDAILIGHDHKLYNKMVASPDRDSTLVLDAGTAARNVGHITLMFDRDNKLQCNGEIVSMLDIPVSDKFMSEFSSDFNEIKSYSQMKIGTIDETIYAYESLFGSSAFVDMVHRTMLKHTDAQISLSAPLLINSELQKGDVTIGNMFSIYRYENKLTTMRMTGEEIKNYLEYSYDLWITNPSESRHLLKLTENRLSNPFYNFDSAAGIEYTVNPYLPYGQRITITQMSNGEAFDITKSYVVALNSYRSNGGGGHLEKGAGIAHSDINSRIIKQLDSDLRGLIIEDIQESGRLETKPLNNWKFVPEKELKKIKTADIELFK